MKVITKICITVYTAYTHQASNLEESESNAYLYSHCPMRGWSDIDIVL